MPGPYFDARDAKNAGLHLSISLIERELARLPPGVVELRSQWRALLALLAVEPVHELRECPTCNHVGMRAATRCGHCWAKLSPVAELTEPENPAITRGVD